MTNDLRILKKELKSFAKRVKDFKYTDSALITFLLTGLIMLSGISLNLYSDEIKTQQEAINTSIFQLQKDFKRARQENNKLLRNTNLELIQLMEQGDHVVKSPWGSFQFGSNYVYNDWKGTYKGRGDKKEAIKYARENDKFGTYAGAKQGTTELKRVIEPISAVPVDAAVRPKDIRKTALNINLPNIGAPKKPDLNVGVADPLKIKPININVKVDEKNIVQPNANPFSSFSFNWMGENVGGALYYNGPGYTTSYDSHGHADDNNMVIQGVNLIGGKVYSGVKTDGSSIGDNIAGTDGTISGVISRTGPLGAFGTSVSIPAITRNSRALVAVGFSFDGAQWNSNNYSINGTKFYLAGSTQNAMDEDWFGSTNNGQGWEGTSGIHLLGGLNVVGAEFNLYGKAAAVNMEEWQDPQLTIDNTTTINVLKDNNTLFNVQTTGYGSGNSLKDTWMKTSATINVGTKDNTVFAYSGFARSFSFEDTGKIKLEGASNIGASVLGHVTDTTKYTGDGNQYPKLEIGKTNAVEQYGDEDVTLFLSARRSGTNRNQGFIGIFQGDIEVNSKIGEYLNSNKTSIQTTDGQLAGVPTSGYTPQTVDGNVGVYANSGQRKGMLPSELGYPSSAADADIVKNLEIGKFDIRFGKYAKNGFMFISKDGTVMEVGKNIASFSDGINGSTTTETDASTGTVIAYSEGTWNHSKVDSTNTINDGKPSEIYILKNLTMVSKEGIAYFGDNQGIVNVGSSGATPPVVVDTNATGYGSIIGYAKDSGKVNINGQITASDSGVTTLANKFTNIGAYALNGGQITVEKKATINGLGAIADGTNSSVILKATDNEINTGSDMGTTLKTAADTGLYATNAGAVYFNGGTITNKDNSAARGLTDNDHEDVTPFYVKGSGQIIFGTLDGKNSTAAQTLIKMYDGILMTSDPANYVASIDGSSKYQNLGKVTVDILGDNVTIGSYDNKNFTWDDPSDASKTYSTKLGLSVFADVHKNGHIYKTILTNGKLDITSPTVTLDSATDEYNGIKMGNELVTISNGTTVSGNIGAGSLVAQGKAQGLSMGNLPSSQLPTGMSASNTTSGFINKGTVNVTGGTTAAGIAGINVSYGTINNDKAGKVTVDNGAGLYATNGSKIVNDGTVTVSGKGVGIAGLGTGQTKQDYGTDVANGTTVEIVNNGTLNVSGDEAIGIYAENNTGTARTNVKIDNTSPITVGTKGVGIALVSTAPTTVSHGAEQGGTITLTPAGATDITTGVQGTGIYAEDSDINLGSGDYVVETKEKGVGIFASGNTKVNGTLEYKYNGSATGTGMGIVYDQDKASNLTNYANVKLTNSTNTTGGMVGLYTTAAAGNKFINNGNVEGKSTALEFGIVTNGADVENAGKITLGDATKQAEANVGIYAKAKNKISNSGTITVGNNAIGIYGYNVDNNGTIKAGDNGAAIYTQDDGTVNLNGGSTVKVGGNQAVGVYAVGTNQNLNANAGSTFSIGDDSFGFVDAGKGNTITSYANPVTLGSDAIYAYQNDNTGKIVNYTPLTSSGDRNYGLYGNGTTENYGTIDFSNGNGNVGIYSTNGGVATNFGTIKVGPSNTSAKEYGVGMATGYYDEATNKTSNEGTIINRGTIEVSKANTMGMYAVGPGSKAINYGTINLSGRDTIGMYLDRGAHGENWGTIQTTVSGLRGVKGIYLSNGSYIKNYGTINIAASDIKSAGIWADTQSFPNAEENSSGRNPITGASQTGTSTPLIKVVTADDMKEMGGVTIKVPPRMTPVTVTDAQGNVIPIVKVDTDTPAPNPVSVTVTSPSGITTLNLAVNNMQNFPSASEATSIGMYVDTSGVNYTNPIQGLNNLVGLEDISLYFGPEASRYTTSKAIEIGDNILKPYNDALRGLVTAGTTLYVTSPSLTWMAQPTKDPSTGLLDKVYLVKVPYTAFAKDGDDQTYNFLAGLEKRYGVEGLGTQEKLIFDKISSLTGGEGHILAQAIDEMKGHQYSNIQQRTKETGDILNNEFSYLQNEWENPTKDSSKIKAFGQRGEYKTDTAGVVDYASNAYGVAYVHEKEGVTLGNKTGWYAGAVTNHFKFKDLGRSREDQTMMKAGIFKTVSPAKDHNGSLQWTISGEAFAGANHMKRRYWVVDDTFEAKSDYATYGVALRNELGKDIRTSERTSIRPYGALNLEYGRYTGIKEDGPMALEVRGNDYISVQPEAGVSFNYRQPVGLKSSLKASLAAAYTNELGEVNDVKNKAKLRGADAPHYELRGDKENRKGSGKFDLNLGFENTRFGVTVNAGYDTKGENVRGGIGFRAIY